MEKLPGTWVRSAVVCVLALALAAGCSSSNHANPQPGVGGAAGSSLPAAGGGPSVDAGVDSTQNDAVPDAPTSGTTPVKLVFGPPVLNMTEGQSMPGTLMVGLDQEWSTAITVTITSSNPNVATVIQDSVTFPPMTMTAKPVQIIAPVDDDTISNTTTIVATAVETGAATVTVNVDDPDVQSLLPLPTKISMTEGRTETLSVRLAKKPASAIVVTLASSDAAKVTVDTAMLTFNAANYSIPQSVTLSALKDDDANSEHVAITLTPTGNIQGLSVPVDVTDVDAVNLDVTPSSLTLEERANMPGKIMVALTKAPPNDMNVQVVSSNMAKVTVTPGLLTFTAANFATPQEVTVAAVPDNDGHDEAEKITFTATALSPAPEPRDVAVKVHDSDSQSIVVSPATVSLVEGGTGMLTVQLALQPDGDTTVNVYSQNPDKLQLVPPVLHFNATNYNVPQTVTVSALQDDDLADGDVNITLIASAAASVTATAHIRDDDHQAIQLVPAGGGSSLVMQEGASSALGVRLAFRPANGATVTLAASTRTGPDKLSVTPTQVVFSGADYAVPKFVTLSALHLPDMIDIQAAVTASEGDSMDVTLPVTILDVDTQNLLVDTDAITVTEGGGVAGAAASFTVKLALQPPVPVAPVFTLSPSLTGKVALNSTACASLSGAGAMTTGCAVTVTPLVDNDIRKESGTVTISAPGLTPRTIAVTVTDTDTQGLTMVPASIAAIPEGMTGTFMVGLKANPIDPVTVSVLSGDPAHFTVSPATLAFTSANFAAGLAVTVTALDDNDMASFTSSVSVQGAGAGATDPATANVDVSSTNTDVQAIVVSPGPSLTMLEGSMAQLGVRLAYRPVAGEVVTLTSANPALLQFGGTASTTVTFDSTAAYSTNQFVTLTSIKDSNMVDDVVNVTASSSLAATPPPAAEVVTISDVDVLNFKLSSLAPVSVTEGTSTPAMITVGLTVSPALPVAVTVTSSIPSSSLTASFLPGPSVSGGNCTLTSVTSTCVLAVAAVEDANGLAESGSITIAGGPATIASQSIAVSTVDNDMQGLDITPLLSPTNMPITSIHERASGGVNRATFTVALHTQPAAPVTVNVQAIPDATDGIALSTTGMAPAPGSGVPVSLTFTPDDYGVRTVTVTGVPDNDLRTDPFSIRVTAPGLGVTDAFVNVTEIDDDTQHIIITPMASGSCPMTASTTDDGTSVYALTSLAEGSSMSRGFCVSLQYQPLSNTVVNVAVTPSPLLFETASTTGLSFSTLSGVPGGYDRPQPLSVMAGTDLDAAPEAGEINLSSSGFAATRKVTITVTDPNVSTQVLNFVGLDGSNSISIPKGTMSSDVSVWIPFDPISPTQVVCTAASPVSISTPLTFTGGASGTWGSATTAQALTIIVGNGSGGGTQTVTVTCSTSGAMPSIPSATFTVNATP